MNSGYVGYSRSVRSQSAIEDFEMPISLINKDIITGFLKEYEDEYTDEQFFFLKTLSVEKWKYVAKEHTAPASWHHTSNHFNETDHYDLRDVATTVFELKSKLDQLYNENKNQNIDVSFGVIEVQIWGGTRKRPKVIGSEVVAGIIIGKWLYYKEDHDKDRSISKYKTDANKVLSLDEFNNYDELVKKHKEFKNTKRVFNALIKEKVK